MRFVNGLSFLRALNAHFFIALDPAVLHNGHFAAFLTHKAVEAVRMFMQFKIENFRNVDKHLFRSSHHLFHQRLDHLVGNFARRNTFFSDNP